MSPRWKCILATLMVMLLAVTGCGGGSGPSGGAAGSAGSGGSSQPAGEQSESVPEDWAYQPMKSLATVVLSVESGAQEKVLQSFAADIRERLNIDLKVVTHPFSEQYQIQYLDLSSGAGQFDILSHWPSYTADFAPFLTPLKDIAPGGAQQVAKDLQLDDVYPAYLWAFKYRGEVYATQYDGDVKLLHYRRDQANDPKEREAFKARYGYDFDVHNLTWDQYRDVAEFFSRPGDDFYGAAEIAGFLAFFTWVDRYLGMGGHFFDENMNPFPQKEIFLKSVQNAIDVINKGSAPEARSFEFEDARNQIISQNRAMFVPQWPDVWKWAADPALSKAVCKVGVAEMPGFERDGRVIHRPHVNGGRVLTINKASKVKEAAYKVLVYLSQPERTANLVYNNDTWLDPFRKAHFDPNSFTHLNTGCPETRAEYVEVQQKSLSDGYPALQIPGTGRYTEVGERWAKKAFAGQVTPEEMYDNMVKEFDAITNDLGRDKQTAEYRAFVDGVLKPAGLYP